MNYILKNPLTDTVLEDIIDSDDGFVLSDPDSPQDTLLQTEYPALPTHDRDSMGFYGLSWLPLKRPFENQSGPVCFTHKALSDRLGLPHLSIVYSGYSATYGAYNTSGTFKEFEALGVLGRLGATHVRALVLASAGNTARAFITAYSAVQDRTFFPYKLIVVVPDYALHELWSHYKKNPRITIVALKNGDYSDAIALVSRITQRKGYIDEGGVKNVGRRDGMGSTFLSYYFANEGIPEHYFQAVGSASGAIAAWEIAKKLKHFGVSTHTHKQAQTTLPILHLSQNATLSPIVWAWEKKDTSIASMNERDFKQRIPSCYSSVLTNRLPPYSIAGGIYQICTESKAQVYGITWNEAKDAQALCKQEMGIDICASSAICVASLLAAIKKKTISSQDTILLNITGGGFKELRTALPSEQILPDITIDAVRDLVTTNMQEKIIDSILLHGEHLL